jgi:hypothetical protein
MLLQLAAHLQEHASSASTLPGLHSAVHNAVLLPSFSPSTQMPALALVACLLMLLTCASV